MELIGWIILGVVNIPVYVLLGWIVFNSWDNFGEAVVFLFKPDIFSAFQGEFWQDRWAFMKLVFFLGACGLIVYTEAKYIVIPYVVPIIT